MRWLTDWLAAAWALAILLVIFLGPFVLVGVLVSYLWGML
jgi:hypothetical protein